MTREEAISRIQRALSVPNRLQGLVLIDEESANMAIESLQAPTVERPKGEWVLSDNPNILYECSNCGHGFPHKRNGKSTVFYFQNFCPNCGADMMTKESAE